MPILPSIKPSDASDEVEETYDKVAENYGGVVPELYRQLANSPTYLSSPTEHMGRVMAPGAVDAKTKPAFGRSPWLVTAIAVVWGVTVIADSALFSAIVTDVADPRLVGTAVTLQLAAGFTLTTVTIWLVPLGVAAVGWSWAFLLLLPGPLVGLLAMRLLDRRLVAVP